MAFTLKRILANDFNSYSTQVAGHDTFAPWSVCCMIRLTISARLGVGDHGLDGSGCLGYVAVAFLPGGWLCRFRFLGLVS